MSRIRSRNAGDLGSVARADPSPPFRWSVHRIGVDRREELDLLLVKAHVLIHRHRHGLVASVEKRIRELLMARRAMPGDDLRLIVRAHLADLPQVFVLSEIIVDAVDALLQRLRLGAISLERFVKGR